MIGGQTTYKIKRTYQSPKTMAEALRKDDLTTIEAGHIVNYSQASMSRLKLAQNQCLWTRQLSWPKQSIHHSCN